VTTPTFTLPVDLTIECDASTNTTNTGVATTQADNCDTNPTTSYVDSELPGACASERLILRAWTVVDDCGNATTATQLITVVDTTPPTFTLPIDVTIECDASTNSVDTGFVSGQSDNCDGAPTAVFVDTVEAGACAQESTILRAWTVRDVCGNSTTAVQTITIVDTTAPTFSAPADITVECDASTNVVDTGSVTNQLDNCDTNPAVTFADTVVAGACPNEEQIFRVWTATDDCGNASSATQILTVVDTTNPTIVCPSNYSVVADNNCAYVLPTISPVSSGDNCGPVTVTQVPTAGTTLTGPGPHTITLTVTDACGNSSNCAFELSLRCPGISVSKSVYYSHDGGASCPGDELATGINGTPVTYCIIVSNTGATVLADVTITDNDITPPVNVNLGTLAVGAVTSIFVETTIDGDLVNTANASATPAEDDGTPLPSGPVTDDDTAEVDEINPALTISKSVYLGHDGGASCPGSDFESGTNNTAVTYCFTVTNTGDTVLSSVTISDAQVSPAFSTNIGVLAIGASVTVFLETTINADLVNTADASGIPSDSDGNPHPGQDPVVDDDEAEVDLIGPGLQLLKTVYYGHDGGAGCDGTDLVINTNNAPVTYCFTVVNTGDTFLNNVVVTDNDLTPPQSFNLGLIAPGTSATAFVELMVDGDLVNNASASGQPSFPNGDPIPGQPPVGDDDVAEVDEISPGITITKSVYLNHDSGGSCPGGQSVTAQNGDPVTYCFVIENSGDTDLADVTVVDNDLTPPVNVNLGFLPAGATTSMFVEVSVNGDLVNTASATGTPVDENGDPIPDVDPPTDDDDAVVDEVDTGAGCAGAVQSVSAQNGDPVTYCFLVQNTGDTVLANVSVTDNDLTPPVNIAIGILPIGGSTNVFVEVNVDGDLTNTAQAVGTPADSDGNPLPEQPVEEAEDDAEVDEVNPGISIAKSVYLGHDSGGSCPGGEQVSGLAGDAITYCFIVTNTGDTFLSNVMITDNDLTPPVSINLGLLAPGAVVVEFVESSVMGDLTNTASASGTPSDPDGNPLPEQPPVGDDDEAEVDEVNPSIRITKSVYLTHDGGASCAGAVQIVQGQSSDPITYCFLVENTGDTPLADVTVTDNDISPPVLIQIGLLPIGGSTNVFAESTIQGDLVNTASATGDPADENGDPLPEIPDPTDEDTAEVDQVGPGIQLLKTVYIGHDGGASCPGANLATGDPGDDLTYCFLVVNTGDTPLTNVSVSDPVLGLTLPVGFLPIGGTTNLAVEATLNGDLVNTASASGTPADPNGNPIPEQPPVTDEDSAEVDEVNPAINIAKTVYLGHDTGASCPGGQSVSAQNGDAVTYCFSVTNTGDVLLTNVMVVDNDLTSPVNLNLGTLAVGASTTVWVEVSVAGDLVNTASATGTPSDPDGNPLPDVDPPSDSDDAEVDEINPSIGITKTVYLGHDGGTSCPGIQMVSAQNGDPVTYCFLVENTGDVPLTNVSVVDNDLSPAFNAVIGFLPVGGSSNVFVQVLVDGDLVNTAQASGTPSDPDGNPLPEQPEEQAQDDAEVDEIGPGISIAKSVYAGHDGGASCPGVTNLSVLGSTPVTYCFVVVNTGDTYLNDVTITDNDITPPVSIVVGLMAPGSSVTQSVESVVSGDLTNNASATGIPSDEDGDPLPDQPPVGDNDEVVVDEVNPSVAVEKTVYLGHDGGASCPGVQSLQGQSGDAVTYCFLVLNTGDTPLANVMVVDNDLSPAVSITVGFLPVGGSSNVFAESTIQGDLINTASVSGDPADEDGDPLPDVPPVGGEDIAEVDQVGPGIRVLKTVYIGHDGGASCPGVELATGDAGDDVTYCFLVENTGDTPLTNVSITDNTLGVTLPVPFLPVAGSHNAFVESTLAGDLVNTASVTGTPSDPDGNPIPGQPPVGDDDNAEVDEVMPGISIDKSVYLGHDDGASCPGTASISALPGGAVTYCFLVANTGDTPLADVMVVDNDLTPPVSMNLGTLAIGASTTVYVEVAVAGDLVNTASATGIPTDADGNPLPDVDPPSAQDTAEVDEVMPGVQVVKTVYLGHDGGTSCPGGQSIQGQNGQDVTYCFLVLNSGDTALVDVTITDNDITPPFSATFAFLPVGGATNAFVETTVAGDLVNTVSASAVPADPTGVPLPGIPAVVDEDEAEVDAIAPGISISKSVYLGHDTGASCPGSETVAAQLGDAVTYCFVVTNTGNTYLADVTITDNDLTPPVSISVGLMAPGAVVTEFVEREVTGDLTNRASAAGTPSDENGNPIPGQDPVGDIDEAVVDAIMPGISIAKSVYLGHDSGIGCPGSEAVTAASGDAVTYCFVVTNTGDTFLTDVTITDNDLTPPVSITIGLLAPGRVVTEYVERTVTSDLVNRASASGTPADENGNPLPGQAPVVDEDTASVDQVGPGIAINKSVYRGHDNGASCPGAQSVAGQNGTLVTYCFVVENTGDTYLADVTITDNDLTPPVSIAVGLMAPGDIVTEFVETTLIKDLVNNASASGVPSDENGNPLPGFDPVGANDTAEADLINPAIGLAKDLSTTVNNGDGTFTVTFEFTLENLGDVPLSDMVLIDDIRSQFAAMNPVSFFATSGSLDANPQWDGRASSNILSPGQGLDIGEMGNVYATFTVSPGSLTLATNTAEVTASDPYGDPVTDLSTDGLIPDPSGDGVADEMVPTLVPFSMNPRLELDKQLVSISSEGTTFSALYRFIISNTGDVVINDLQLTDDILGQYAGYQPRNLEVQDGSLVGSPAWDGTANSNMLAPGQSVMPGQQGDVTASFDFVSTTETSIENTASVTGTAPNGEMPRGEDSEETPLDFPPANITGVVWEDSSGNGIVDEDLDVFGLGDITVFLYLVAPDGSETLIDSVKSDQNGQFTFANLPPGTYRSEVAIEEVPPTLVNQSTPLTYTSTLEPGQGDDTHNYGVFPAPTAIGLERFDAFVTENGVTIKWLTAWEDETLGFFVYKVAADGTIQQLNQALILAEGGNTEYTLELPDATGGRYLLEELENDLDRNMQTTVAYAQVDGAPVGEPTKTVTAESMPVQLTTTAAFDTYLVAGFDTFPQVVDATDPENPREIVGELITASAGHAAYFSAPAGLQIIVQERETIPEEE